jgi:hypothetical protein
VTADGNCILNDVIGHEIGACFDGRIAGSFDTADFLI